MIIELKHLATILPGFPFRGSIEPDAQGDALVITMKDVSRSSPLDWPGLTRTRLHGRKPFPFLQKDDILLVMRGGNYFAVHLANIPEPAVAAQHFFVVRPHRQKIVPAFLTWQMNHGPAQNYFLQAQAGSLQLSLRRADVEQLPVVVPPLAQQHNFAALAGNIYAQQENLRQQLNTTDRLLDGLAASLHAQERN